MHESAIEASRILREERSTTSYTEGGRQCEASKGTTDQQNKKKNDALFMSAHEIGNNAKDTRSSFSSSTRIFANHPASTWRSMGRNASSSRQRSWVSRRQITARHHPTQEKKSEIAISAA
jgi:hypothetical protein